MTLLVGQSILQHIARPRLFQMQDAHDQVGNIQRFGTTVDHLLTGIVDDFTELCRCLWFVVTVRWYCLHFYHFSEQTVCHLVRPAVIAERLYEYLVAHHGQQQVFGRYKLVPVVLTVLPSYVQYSCCTF